ncbi:MAG: 2TM domain-containing protein [Solirubrobacterales bacterium]
MVERHEVEEGVDKPEDARQLAIQRLKMKRDFLGLVGSGALAIIVTTVIWAMGGGGDYWPKWVILGVAIGLVVQGWKAYGPNNRITEADVRREMERG